MLGQNQFNFISAEYYLQKNTTFLKVYQNTSGSKLNSFWYSAYSCLYCEQKTGGVGAYEDTGPVNQRTLGRLNKCHSDFMETGKGLKINAKNYFSCINPPILRGDDATEIIMLVRSMSCLLQFTWILLCNEAMTVSKLHTCIQVNYMQAMECIKDPTTW